MQRSEQVVRMRLGGVEIDVRGALGHGPGLPGGFASGDLIDVADPRPPPRLRQPDGEGRITALRSPVAEPAAQQPLRRLSVMVPDEPTAPGGVPWSAIVPSVASGAVAAVVFNPLFAILAGVSASVLFARWVAGRVRYRRLLATRSRMSEAAESEFEAALVHWQAAERAARVRGWKSPLDLVRTAAAMPIPWHRRLHAGEALDIALGSGPEPASVIVSGLPEPRSCVLDEVPIVVKVEAGRALAVIGDRASALDTVRWLIASSSERYGPADIGILVVTTDDRLVDWDWLKWLPHLEAVAATEGEAHVALSKLDGRTLPALVVVDGPEPAGPGYLAQLLAGRLTAARTLWIGDASSVPASCSHRLVVEAGGAMELLNLLEPSDTGPVRAAGYALGAEEAERVARSLTPFDDPDRDDQAARLPASVPFAELLEVAAGDSSHGTMDPGESIGACWDRATRRSLIAPLGVGDQGPVVVDLVADGPHALVAGTTGSGKSEMLRTLVAGLAHDQPPDLVAFVLVDFKGGGAFDVVAGLPHVSAVVTDLDAFEAARALRSLRAELQAREQRLRDLGASDLSDVPLAELQPFPRLVVVVDEFAALADELPEFLDGLVDIARRGRSLGVHLVLATQRPAGVVTGAIRANTNLRICLRVQDRSDSADVIDVAAASELPSIPGRALIRSESGVVRQVQIAHLGGDVASTALEPFVVHAALLDERHGGTERRAAVARVERALGLLAAVPIARSSPVVPFVDGLIARSKLEVRARGIRTLEPPWLEPLQTAKWSDVEALSGRTLAGFAVPVGLLDDPDRRCRVPLTWDATNAGLLVLGGHQNQIEQSVIAVVYAAISVGVGRREVPDVVILDGGSGLLHTLLALPAVGDVITAAEPERLLKAVSAIVMASVKSTTRSRANPLIVVVNGWQAIADALLDAGGSDAVEGLVRLARGRHGQTSVVVTGKTDREVPGRVAAQLGARVIHKLSDVAGYLSFGLRVKEVPNLTGAGFVDPDSGLAGVALRINLDQLEQLVGQLDGAGAGPSGWPQPVRVLGSHVLRSDLAKPEHRSAGHGPRWLVPVGLDLDLEEAAVLVAPGRPVLVVGQPGSGRSTALATIRDRLPADADVIVLDDAELLTAEEVSSDLASGSALVIGCTVSAARSFGSWVQPLLPAAQVVMLNPTRVDGELCRVIIPDLSASPTGRAVLIDRGRVTVLQVAA